MVRILNLFIIIAYIKGQDIGSKCVLENGSQSICKHIELCRPAQEDLRNGVRPQLCGFIGNIPIVCCDDKHENMKENGSLRISEQKCREYSQLDIRTTITTTTNSPDTKNLYFVTGGLNASFEEFPHMAILGYGQEENFEYQCGGSLVSEYFILTAAHCLISKRLGPVTLVRLGDLDIFSNLDLAEPQDFKVAATYPHPDYSSFSFYHDIALIKLDRPAVFTKYVKPACVQSEHELQDNELIATGWGALYFGGRMHSHLQKVYLNNLPLQHCLPTYGPQPRLPKGIDEQLQICGGNLNQTMDTCQGDSGGPLQIKIQNFPLTHKVVGITSFGSHCGLVPGVYTRVSRYIDWIESAVWSN